MSRESKDGQSLEVKCKYCGKYFKPLTNSVKRRVRALKGLSKGEHSLYCSDDCKNNCGTFRKKDFPEGLSPITSREVQPQLRKLVLERDNWTCQKCDRDKDLHCHHIEYVVDNPIESADVDNCITLCKKCHIKVHKQSGCGYHKSHC